MKFNHRFILALSIQFFILTICSLLQMNILKTSPVIINVVCYAPYIISIIGIILGICFNRSKIFFIILFLILSEFLLTNYTTLLINKSDFMKLLYPIVCIALSINIALFSYFKESGIFSLWGRAKFILIALELYIIFMAVISKNIALIKTLNYPLPILSNFNFPITRIPFIIICSVLMLLIIKCILTKSSNFLRLSMVLISVFIALIFVADKTSVALFFSAADIILILEILEASYSMAYLDELTGIPSRRALREDLMKLGSRYSIAMLDIDFFKKFNDNYGHDVGDDVLRLVAENIQNVDGGGKAYRYGGEEFTILFPNKSASEALPHLETLRQKVSKAGYSKPSKNASSSTKSSTKKQLYVTISIGLAEKNSNYKKPEEVIEAADKALYRAKKKGRNCTSK